MFWDYWFMNFIQSQNRQQMLMSSWDSSVESDNPFRLIDVFVDQLDLVKLKLQVWELKREGRPAFESVVFLKLYFYGYLNSLRSSRRLERECCRNIELQWLLGGLRPNYHSIADFRKHNPLAPSKRKPGDFFHHDDIQSQLMDTHLNFCRL